MLGARILRHTGSRRGIWTWRGGRAFLFSMIYITVYSRVQRTLRRAAGCHVLRSTSMVL